MEGIGAGWGGEAAALSFTCPRHTRRGARRARESAEQQQQQLTWRICTKKWTGTTNVLLVLASPSSWRQPSCSEMYSARPSSTITTRNAKMRAEGTATSTIVIGTSRSWRKSSPPLSAAAAREGGAVGDAEGAAERAAASSSAAPARMSPETYAPTTTATTTKVFARNQKNERRSARVMPSNEPWSRSQAMASRHSHSEMK